MFRLRSQKSGFKQNVFLNCLFGMFVIGASFAAFAAFLPKHKAAAQGSGQQPRIRPTPRPTPPPTAQSMFAPLAGVVSPAGAEVAINNNGPEDRVVSPVFYDLEGNAHPAGTISLNPLEVRHLEMSSLLPQSLNNLNRVGGLSLSYNGGMMEVVAQITVFGDGNEGSVDIPFSATMDYRSATQNAVWWMPRNSKSTIILGNATDTAITATLNFSSGDSQNVELAPHASATVEKRANGNQGDTSESVRVTSTGAAGSLRVTGYVRTNDKKFASAIHFYDPQNARQSNLYASNFRVKGMEAFLVLRNLGEAALTATPKFFPTNGTNPVELPAVTIAPQQNLKVNLELLVSAAASRSDLDQVSVQIISSGAAGNLIGALTSANSARRMTWSVPLRDSGPTRNSTGGYPWKLSDDYNTIVSITNVSERATKYIASLNFTGERINRKPENWSLVKPSFLT